MLNPKMPIATLDHIECECGCEKLFFSERMLNDDIYFKIIEQSDEEDGADTFVYVIEYETDDEGIVTRAMKYMIDWYEGTRPFRNYQIIKDINDLYVNNRKIVFMNYINHLSSSRLLRDDFDVILEGVQEDLDFIYCSIDEVMEQKEKEMDEIIKVAIKETDEEFSTKTE